MKRLLVANRGEIAVRILRTAADLGVHTIAVYAPDDATSLHVRRAAESIPLEGRGAAAYLDLDQIVRLAVEHGADAVHPGYGFLAERAAFARACRAAGVVFVGPSPEVLDLCGDKAAARRLAERCGVPVLAGTGGPTSLEEAEAFMAGLGGRAVMVKAVAGGGGRGMREVTASENLSAAYERCRSEAQAGFGVPDVYVEELIEHARHVEVQVVGDGTGAVTHLWDRECSVQRQHQKLVEVAPSPALDAGLRDRLLADAVRLASEVDYHGLGTFEFLVDARRPDHYAFIEANARIQVEHTVTEMVTGLDLVALQLALADGARLADLDLTQAQIRPPDGVAVQARVNTETMTPEGTARPTGGTITAFEVPSGPGVRTDTYGTAGYTTSPAYDSLLAKVVAHAPTYEAALARCRRALSELRVDGVVTNAAFLGAVLAHDDVVAGRHTTRWLGDHVVDLLAASAPPAPPAPEPEQRARAGVKVDARDPLAVLAHGKGAAVDGGGAGPAPAVAVAVAPSDVTGPEGSAAVRAPIQGTIVSVTVTEGEEVLAGQGLLVMEAMKMEHVVAAPASGVVAMVTVEPGDTIFEGHPLVFVTEGEVSLLAEDTDVEVDLDHIRPDLAEVIARHRFGDDESRPEAVARRTEKQYRTVRENVDDLIDPGSLREYGALVVAAQRRRRSVDDLMANTPADGLVAGVASVNGDLFDERAAQCVVVAYDYTVLAGTQGTHNHLKKDKMFELAGEWRLPVVVYTEGGGGRPGDTDGRGAGLDCWAFHYYGRLSGLVPLVGVNNGYCFAGNAALLGTCDVVIATATSNIGMGGPAMIEGGNLGVFHPTEVGPMSVQRTNGVVDIAVADEKEATAVAKRYLSYFQGDLAEWDCADQRLLRSLIPENRLRIYDVRRVIETIADTGTVLELRRDFGLGMVTSLLRIEGRPVGVVANNPTHLAGAIDSDGADKAARFMQLCDNFDIPLLFLCDTPGMMVGPEVEKTALVRHCCRLFAIGANLSVPACTIVLRKGYGLGAQAMAAGSFKAPYFTVAWPTGEFGGMGLEGAVKLGYRKELEAETDPDARVELYQKMVDRMYEAGKAVNTAMTFEIDDVIDPAESRHWITSLLVSRPSGSWRDRPRKRPHLDTW